MRRQARDRAGGARSLRTATALQVWLWLLVFVFQNEFKISKSIQPGYLDFDNLPETNFTCAGKVIGGYYADLETSCQMFHVCTVGQQDEPMDIKFLCLNGTVFDQETRVCERVDEVDCTKSEKFYSLNLELYGSTAPPIIQPEQIKPKVTEQSSHVVGTEAESDPSIDDLARHDNENNRSPEVHDSTEDPPQDGSSDQDQGRRPSKTHQTHPTLEQFSGHVDPSEESQEDEEDDNENQEYEDFTPIPPTTTTVTTTTSTKPPSTTVVYITSQSSATAAISSEPPRQTTLLPAPAPSVLLSAPTSSPRPVGSYAYQASPSGPTLPNPSLDSAFLTPEQFIYQHRGPGSEAISFQRQSSRPESLYITHAPSQQFDHFQYESSRTAPRSPSIRSNVLTQRPQPSPFRATTPNPRDQLLRPGPASQPSERHETTVKHRHANSPLSALPASRPLPLEPFHLEYKRHQESRSENQASLSARSAAPPTHTTRIPPKPKSPPKVIVTASASVSDSNGKKLNYTVGNVVSAVKPIVQINYDDYKESDLIFDPFFLDVPKLQKRRKERSNDKIIVTVPPTTTSPPIVTSSKISTTYEAPVSITSSTTVAWNPDDYVDDNYEPQAYVPAAPPLVALLSLEKKHSSENLPNKKNLKDDHNSKTLNIEQNPTLLVSITQTPSSQNPVQVVVPTQARIKSVALAAMRNLHTTGFVSS